MSRTPAAIAHSGDPSFTMSRCLRQLVSLLSLAAFLAGNVPGLAASCGHHPATTAAPAAEARQTCAATSGCCHCRAKRAAAAKMAARAQTSGRHAQVSADPADADEGPACPCCPSPGGCAYCNVAKVPCHAPAVPVPGREPCLGPSVAEAPPSAPPAHVSQLLRPPRA